MLRLNPPMSLGAIQRLGSIKVGGSMNPVPSEAQFPSEAHREGLLQKSYSNRSDAGKWFTHGYHYGFARVVYGNETNPIDPERQWYDAALCYAAEVYWRHKLHKPEKPPEPDRPIPTPDDIAHVELVCRQIRANLAAWADRNDAAFRPVRRRVDPIAAMQRDLGMTAGEP